MVNPHEAALDALIEEAPFLIGHHAREKATIRDLIFQQNDERLSQELLSVGEMQPDRSAFKVGGGKPRDFNDRMGRLARLIVRASVECKVDVFPQPAPLLVQPCGYSGMLPVKVQAVPFFERVADQGHEQHVLGWVRE